VSCHTVGLEDDSSDFLIVLHTRNIANRREQIVGDDKESPSPPSMSCDYPSRSQYVSSVGVYPWEVILYSSSLRLRAE